MKKLPLPLLLFFLSLTTYAQRIDGLVSDLNSQPLPFANVLLLNAADSVLVKGAAADMDGAFSFSPDPGGYLLQVSMMGYETQYSAPITITTKAGNLAHSFTMQESEEMMGEVVVEAKKPLFEAKTDRMVINVANSITSAGNSVLEVLERSPGIRVDRINGVISMQGKEGVIVMLNGKQTRMQASALIQLLNGMSTDNIETIDLITTPPASYDAEGNAGIIEIHTKGIEEEGVNARVSTYVGYGVRGKYGGTLSFTLRKGKVSLFADVSNNADYTKQDTRIERNVEIEGTPVATKLNSSRPAYIGLDNARLGLDYQLTGRTIVGFLASGYKSYWDMISETNTNIVAPDSSVHSFLISDEQNDWTHWMLNVNVRHTFADESRISADFDYLDFQNENTAGYTDRVTTNGTEAPRDLFTSKKLTPIHFKVSKIDYARSLSDKTSVKLGVKATISDFINDISVERFRDPVWTFDDLYTDKLYLDEEIYAAYGSADYKFSDKVSAKAGLRYEYINSILSSDKQGDIRTQHYGRLFPTAYLSYTFEPNSLQLSYNERITRPSLNDLAPAFFFWGPNTILTGNPSLQPTISRQGGLTLNLKSAVFTLQYTDYNNAIFWTPVINAEENEARTRTENFDDWKVWSAGLNIPFDITEWWEGRINLTGYRQALRNTVSDEEIKQSNMYFSGNLTQSFSLPADINAELTANGTTKAFYGYGDMPYLYSINIGLQRTFGNHEVSFNWTDIFNTGSFWQLDYNEPALNLAAVWYYDLEGSIMRLTYAYTFGNNRLKKREDRETGSETERSRVQ